MLQLTWPRLCISSCAIIILARYAYFNRPYGACDGEAWRGYPARYKKTLDNRLKAACTYKWRCCMHHRQSTSAARMMFHKSVTLVSLAHLHAGCWRPRRSRRPNQVLWEHSMQLLHITRMQTL